MSDRAEFDTAFRALTGHDPFPWQREFYERLIAGRVPRTCDIPTGLGKTAVVAVWLIALANHPDKLPRRLVYVVNRRTVVDQTTDEVKNLRANLKGAGLSERLKELCAIRLQDDDPPLAISTLRGQFADNREWSADPARPAVIIGTVDMIGSRLLFSGYRLGFKSKPLHAGFLAQHVLLVHDEAHLEPAFQQLLIEIRNEQERCKEFRSFRVTALTATSRELEETNQGNGFGLTDKEKNPPVVMPDPPTEPIHHLWRRVKAPKAIHLVPVEDEKKDLADKITDVALELKYSKRSILVFARTVENVEKILTRLRKQGQRVQQLTGTLRGLERDQLVDDPVFRRFLRHADPGEETAYLVCTSAGEVGVNITADHLVCDLTTFESMAQRFGRVNRFGEHADTEIHVVHPMEFDEKEPYEQCRRKTLELLQQLDGDGSPAALGKLDPAARTAAFAPEPTMLPATDILFDSWALTTIRDRLPGRPPVEPYLHGLEDEKKAETYVAWRQEVWELDLRGEVKSGPLFRDAEEQRAFEQYATELLEDYPLKPHELLRDSTFRRNTGVRDKLLKLGERHPDYPIWIQQPDGSVVVRTFRELSAFSLPGCTVLLPAQAGGLVINDARSAGLLDADKESEFRPEHRHLYDVADEWFVDEEKTARRRVRVWSDDPEFDRKTAGMRLIRCLDLPAAEEDEDAEGRAWYWYELPRAADSEGSKSAQEPVSWDNHAEQVTRIAIRIVTALGLPQQLQEAIKLTARFHDLGKKREVWQRSIGNPNPTDWHAKSGRDPVSGKLWKPRDICPDYRHELGSLLDVQKEPQFQELSPEMKDLVLHLIAAGHGRGRPHFPPDEVFDPQGVQREAEAVAAEVPRRFARLQGKYGRWGLAYLESLLRAADYAASANPSTSSESPGDQIEEV